MIAPMGVGGYRLATFVHVSDTHISEICPRTGDGVISDKVRDHWCRGRRVNGLFGHTRIAMSHLAELYGRLKAREGAVLVHTGDLTALGNPEQFETARDFFRSRVSAGPRGIVGLNDPHALDLAVPGNHDHWPGNGRMLGRASDALYDTFPRLPLSRFKLASGHRLLFAGIDSCADVWPWSPARAFARGSFVSQLKALGKSLRVPHKDEIRVLLLHHSPQHSRWHLGIGRRSRHALTRFVAEHRFQVLLTGHIHSPRTTVRRIKSHLGSFNLLEARCGASLHRDHLPEDWPRPEQTKNQRSLSRNTLMVHRLFEHDGKVTWHTRVHVRGGMGFEDDGTGGTGPIQIE